MHITLEYRGARAKCRTSVSLFWGGGFWWYWLWSTLISEKYFDPQCDMCYCLRCHRQRGDLDYYTRGVPAKDYALPVGWSRLSLRYTRSISLTFFLISFGESIRIRNTLLLVGDQSFRFSMRVRARINNFNILFDFGPVWAFAKKLIIFGYIEVHAYRNCGTLSVSSNTCILQGESSKERSNI